MAKLKLSIVTGRHDRVAPLLDGEVEVEGEAGGGECRGEHVQPDGQGHQALVVGGVGRGGVVRPRLERLHRREAAVATFVGGAGWRQAVEEVEVGVTRLQPEIGRAHV